MPRIIFDRPPGAVMRRAGACMEPPGFVTFMMLHQETRQCRALSPPFITKPPINTVVQGGGLVYRPWFSQEEPPVNVVFCALKLSLALYDISA